MERALDPRDPSSLEPRSSRLAPRDDRIGLGISASAFAVLALFAIFTARALAPALPGSATGIAEWIAAASFVAACTSQLVAAGGIALCLRLLGSVLILPALGVAFRMLILPLTLGVVALVVGAAARSLDPNLGRVLSITCVLAPASAAALLLSRRHTRAVGIVLLLAALGAAFDLAAFEVWRGATASSPAPTGAGRALAWLALALDAAAALLAFVWAARDPRRAATGIAIALLGTSVVLWLASVGSGASHDAPAWQVVLHRSIDGLTRRPIRASTASAAELLSLLPVVLGGALLALRGRNGDLRAALALCLLGRTSTGAPAAALLSVGAALLAVPYVLQEKPERARSNSVT